MGNDYMPGFSVVASLKLPNARDLFNDYMKDLSCNCMTLNRITKEPDGSFIVDDITIAPSDERIDFLGEYKTKARRIAEEFIDYCISKGKPVCKNDVSYDCRRFHV
ncbi:MAG: hypothetical protein HY513_01800 [Candidatus Aenigmarchaeota archaeon]|nr:hypothetical protein [Candidatus Aenigmarchaeota archaeon]